MKHVIIPIFIAHLGCPHTCVFCDQTRISGTGLAAAGRIDGAAVRRITGEYLASLRPGEHVVELAFYGGTFTAIPAARQIELLTAARDLKQAGLIQSIRCSTRPDAVDEAVLRRLADFGLDTIELGVQSLDDAVLRASGRGHDAAAVEAASRLIQSFGLTLGHQIMPGLPGADAASDRATARSSIALAPAQVRIYPTLVIRGTPLEKLYRRGDYEPMTLAAALDLTGEIMALYEAAGIRILRVGLQGTEAIAPGADLVAGPWHPAFRELAVSARFHGRLRSALAGTEAGRVQVNSRDLSVVHADKKRWSGTYGPGLRFEADDRVPQGSARLIRDNEDEVTLCI